MPIRYPVEVRRQVADTNSHGRWPYSYAFTLEPGARWSFRATAAQWQLEAIANVLGPLARQSDADNAANELCAGGQTPLPPGTNTNEKHSIGCYRDRPVSWGLCRRLRIAAQTHRNPWVSAGILLEGKAVC
jgi:hypothetical protein